MLRVSVATSVPTSFRFHDLDQFVCSLVTRDPRILAPSVVLRLVLVASYVLLPNISLGFPIILVNSGRLDRIAVASPGR